jgi:hypothetical protein
MTAPLMMGFSLAAACGLRGGLPLLVTALFAREGQIPLHPHFAFLTTNTAIGVLLIVTLIEIGGDFIPGLDHALDTLHTLLRPASATLIVAGLLTELTPIVGLLIGLLVGGSISALVHFVKAGVRVVVSTATFGLGNVLLSIFENIVACLLTLFALIAPTLVFFMTWVFLLLVGLVAWRLSKKLRKGLRHIRQHLSGEAAPTTPQMVQTHTVNAYPGETDFHFSADGEPNALDEFPIPSQQSGFGNPD